MKYFILICVLFPAFALKSQCPEIWPVSFDEDIEELKAQYPDCRNLKALSVSGQVTRLTGLEFLDSVGYLRLEHTLMDSINLSDYFLVNGAVHIYENPRLRYLRIVYTDTLKASHDLIAELNPNLSQIVLDAYHIEELGLGMNSDPCTVTFERENMTVGHLFCKYGDHTFTGYRPKLSGILWLHSNYSIPSFEVLHDMFDIDSIVSVNIQDYSAFSSEGSKKFENINILLFNNIDHLNLSYFAEADCSIGTLKLYYCSDINDLSPMEEVVIKNLEMLECDRVESLNGIRLTGEFSGISLRKNDLLSDISAVENVRHPGHQRPLFGANLRDNPLLEWCSYPLICDVIETFPEEVHIAGNLNTCMDLPSVEAACLSAVDDIHPPDSGPFPNPSQGLVSFHATPQQIKVWTTDGCLVFEAVQPGEDIDLGFLPEGLYILAVRFENKPWQSFKWGKI